MEKSQGIKRSGGDKRKIVSQSSPFDSLPEDCISNIVSFTSPREACVAATVSKAFESAVKSNIVWERFIPLEIQSLIPPPRDLSCKKDLYFSLCNDPVLIENGEKSFWLEKASGKSCIMLSARQLAITGGDNPQYWQWIPIPESKFESVAQLLSVCLFEIRGRTDTRFLSPRTCYSAYIVFKKVDQRCHGFENMPIKAEVGFVGQEASVRYVCFDEATYGWFNLRERERNLVNPEERGDEWMEIELGEFFNEGWLISSDDIEMNALHMEVRDWKSGLIIQGIEIRPAKILSKKKKKKASKLFQLWIHRRSPLA